MAIGLSDLAVKKDKIEVQQEEIETPLIEEVILAEPVKQQRPWEAKFQAQKSSVASRAVKKAQEVSMRNEQMAKELRKNFIDTEKELELNQYLENRAKEFENLDRSRKLHASRGRIKTHRSLLKRLRDSLFR